MSASKFANDPALELFATIAVIAKFNLTFVVALFMTNDSMYGDPGTITIAGGIGVSGTLAYTVANVVANAVARAARVSPTTDAGIYCTIVSTSVYRVNNDDTRFVSDLPMRYGEL